MPNFEQQAALLKNQTFLDRITMAIKKVATQVVGEQMQEGKDSLNEKRHKVGWQILNGDMTKVFAEAIVSLGTIDENSIDGDLEWAASAVFNDIAGVKKSEE